MIFYTSGKEKFCCISKHRLSINAISAIKLVMCVAGLMACFDFMIATKFPYMLNNCAFTMDSEVEVIVLVGATIIVSSQVL